MAACGNRTSARQAVRHRRRTASRSRARMWREHRQYCRRVRAGPRPRSHSSFAGTGASALDRYSDIVESRRDRRMRLVHGHANTADWGAARQHRVSDRAGSRLDQSVASTAERLAHGLYDKVIRDSVLEFVSSRGGAELEIELQIDEKCLSDLGFVLHNPMIGVQRQPFEKNRIAHRARLIAAATASA